MDATTLRVLVVDDDHEDYLIIRALLSEAAGGPYRLDWAPDADAARAALGGSEHDVALVDHRLGADDGLQLIRDLVADGCPVPLILLTGWAGRDLGDEALGAGAADFLAKAQLDPDGLARAIRHALTRRRVEDRLRLSEREARRLALVATHTENAVILADVEGRIEWVNHAFSRITGFSPEEVIGRKPGHLLQGPGTDPATVALMSGRVRAGEGFEVEVLNYAKSGREYWLAIDCRPVRDERGVLTGFVAVEADVTERRRAADEAIRARAVLEEAYEATITGWARALDLRDHETEGHSRRVTEMSVRLARAMGLPESEIVHVRRGALLHDIGKMGIPDAILRKPGALDDAERAVMQRHPSLALEMLEPIPFLGPALAIPYCHHERWDGAGYPRGLEGEQIPLAARIFAAVDIWDALSHDRPYRAAWPPEKVRAHIRSLAGSHLDPAVVAAFLPLIEPAADLPDADANSDGAADGAGAEAGPGATSGARPSSPEPDQAPLAGVGRAPDEVAYLETIIAVQAEIAAAGLDLDAVLNLIVTRSRQLTGASGAVIEMAEGDEMVYRAASGSAAGCVGMRLVAETSLSGLCVRAGAVLRCDDAESDARVDRDTCRRVGLRSMIVAPLRHGGRPVGVLKVYAPRPRHFRDRDIRTLELMAGLIGSAMGQAAEADARRRLLAERTEVLEALRASERRLAEQLALARSLNTELNLQRVELGLANARLAELAATDPLTGLANRRQFDAALEEHHARATRQGTPLSVVLADLDGFKRYNDEHGHPAGDEALRVFAAALRAGIREHDLIARYGGEEFAVLLPGADADEAVAIAERLRAAMRAAPWPLRPVTSSFGVATLEPGCPGPWALVGRADEALYRSKSSGRDRVTHHRELPPPDRTAVRTPADPPSLLAACN